MMLGSRVCGLEEAMGQFKTQMRLLTTHCRKDVCTKVRMMCMVKGEGVRKNEADGMCLGFGKRLVF